MSQPLILDRQPKQALLWGTARWTALLAVVPLLVLLVRHPEPTLVALWYVVVPILPATFFLTPALWRGICPLATLNELGNRLGTPRALGEPAARALGIGGLVLFYLLVPARHLTFNQDGVVLAATVAGVGGMALFLGVLFDTRSAFCNAFCPVLPVELLYGQAPLVGLTRGRCDRCTVCTPRGCLDLADQKAVPQLMGPARRTSAWLRTPLGAFFAAMPGFVLGYNLVPDGPLSTAGLVYAATLGAAALSYLLVALLVAATGADMMRALPWIAAAAGGLYYWLAGPSVAAHLGAGSAVSWGVRTVGIGVVGVWCVQILRRSA